MELEFDVAKSALNVQKHSVGFFEIQKLWDDQFATVIDARSETESRFATIGRYKNKIWIAIYTEREKRIRIISVRRARENEERIYYESRRT